MAKEVSIPIGEDMMLPTRKLGPELEVSALGLGCMGMTWAYGPSDGREEMILSLS
jgi:aryl-alcohol dehydrogenase-like predicted oxidoreductase